MNILDNLESDLEILKKDKSNNQDLKNMVFNEDLPELIAFARKVNSAFKDIPPEAFSGYCSGYRDCYEALKREIYGS